MKKDKNLVFDTIKSLEKIYSKIPEFKCRNCHQCCGPIIWFEPEELLIKKYLDTQNITRIVWTLNEFKQNKMKCPYLKNDKCIIYPVRPIVCRLQGNISELKCRNKLNGKQKLLTKKQFNIIKNQYLSLIKKTNQINIFYGTHKVIFEGYNENWKG